MSAKIKLTPSMKRALISMKEGGGSGVISSYGSLIVAGEQLSFEPVTFLRLVSYNLIAGIGGRIKLTGDGVVMANKIKPIKERSKIEAQWDADAEFQMKDQHL